MNLANFNVADLVKVDKLLDRIENEMKKKRTQNFYSSPEKYANYMNKTAELYSLISEEVLSFLDLLGLGEFISTFQKLFRGLHQQVHSMLKFTLYYYNAKSLQVKEAMIRGKMPNNNASGETNTKTGTSFTVKIQKTNFAGQAQTARDRTATTVGSPNNPYLNGSPLTNPDHSGLSSGVNTSEGLVSNYITKTMYMGALSTARSAQDSNYMSGEHDEVFEVETYQQEYDSIKQEIDELLEAKENILKIQPTTLALNLKQVLRSLENTKRNTKVVIDESSDEEAAEDEVDVEDLVKKLMGACGQAQKKTYQKIIDYIRATRNQGQVLFRKDQETMPDPKMLENDKKIIKREYDAIVQQRQQEINFLKKRVETLEQDRESTEDKYSKLLIEHSTCEQEKKDTALQISALESEIANLKEALQENRKNRLRSDISSSGLESPGLRSSQTPANQEVSRRIMEQMSQYRAEIEALKQDLREERRSRVTSKVVESNLVSEAQSPIRSPDVQSPVRSPIKSPLAQSGLGNSKATPSAMKSTAKGKFLYDDKALVAPTKDRKDDRKKDDDNATSGPAGGQHKEKRSDSFALSRKASEAKPDHSLNIAFNNTPRDNSKPFGDSEFRKTKNSSFADLKNGSRTLDIQHQENDELDSENREQQVASRISLIKSDTRGDITSSQPSTKRGNTEKEPASAKVSPPTTLSKVPANDRAQSEDRTQKVNNAKKTAEKTGFSKGQAANNEKRQVATAQEENQTKNNAAKQAHTVEDSEPAAKNPPAAANSKATPAVNAKNSATKAQPAKKNVKNANEKVKESLQEIKDVQSDDDYLLKENKTARKEKKELLVPGEKPEISNSGKKNTAKEEKAREHSVGVDKAVQTDDFGPASFRDHKRNLSTSKETHDKPYNLMSPAYKGLSNTTTGFENQGLNPIHSEARSSRDSSEARLANLVHKDNIKPKVGKSFMPSFDGRMKSPVSMMDDHDDSARNTRARFPTDFDYSPERIYEDYDIKPRHYSKADKMKIKKLDPLDKDMFINPQKKPAAVSVSPQKHREDTMTPQEGDDSQMNVMYKAMRAKAEQDPKIMNIMKNYAREKGETVDEDSDFIPDYNLFVDYIHDLRHAHQRCGENCSHLQRFYARIGYYHIWNKRSPLAMARPDMVEEYGKKKLPSRLPNIPEKKVLKMNS